MLGIEVPLPPSVLVSADKGHGIGPGRQRLGAHEIAEHNRELAAIRLVYSAD
jgi:hypothetical protein